MRIFYIAFIILNLFILLGCHSIIDKETRDIIKKFNGKEVNLSLNNFEESSLFNSKILVYIDSTECSICCARNLIFWQDLIDEYKKIDPDMGFVFIIYPKIKEEIEVEAILYEIGLKNTYIDKEGEFIKKNNFISINKKINVFLLDKDNKVKLVGSPLNNKSLDKLYRQKLNELKSKISP